MPWIEKIWPSACMVCGATCVGSGFCADCRYSLPYNTASCVRCAEPLVAPSSLCRRCLAEPPVHDKARIPLRYEFPVDSLILKMKNGHLPNCYALSRLFLLSVQWPDDMPQVLIPVPMDRRRQQERGFNQSLELSRHLGRAMNIPVDPLACLKPVITEPQRELSASKRRKNLRRAFRLSPSAPCYRSIAVVDDVVTTGSTCKEICMLFRRAGTRYMEIWAVARS